MSEMRRRAFSACDVSIRGGFYQFDFYLQKLYVTFTVAIQLEIQAQMETSLN